MLTAFTSALIILAADPVVAAPPVVRLSFEQKPVDDARFGLHMQGVEVRGFSAGEVQSVANRWSAVFDGSSSLITLARTPASEAAFTAGSFTWEGFFFSPGSNPIEVDGAIADRFLTQFKDDKTGSTRLTIGLGRAKAGAPISLCVAMQGEGSRHVGKLEVIPDVWHHFALIYTAATPSSLPLPAGEGRGAGNSSTQATPIATGSITWYLDYQPCGTIKLDGKTPKTTLLPLGASPLTIGGRNVTAGKVDRGFAGLLDELRITPQALQPEEFLHAAAEKRDRLVRVEFVYPVAASVDWAKLSTVDPTETLVQETLGVVGTPQPFALGGYAEDRRGRQAVRTARELTLPAGRYKLLLRTRCDALLELDGRPLVDARTPTDHPLGPLQPMLRDYGVEFTATGKPQTFRLVALIDYGAKDKTLPEADSTPVDDAATDATADEVIVGIAPLDANNGKTGAWRVLGPDEEVPLDGFAWSACRGRTLAYWATLDAERRAASIARRDEFWKRRHAWASEVASSWEVAMFPHPGPHPKGEGAKQANPIDAFLAAKMRELKVKPAAVVDDSAFLRRVTLDLAGRNPSLAEAQAFLDDQSIDKRAKLVDRLLASSEWADAWVGYWQDLLAENPSILKPTLNNSGPFRRWIHESLVANKPLDRFATELIMMQGENEQGGTAGFAISSGNDLPMAMKGHVLAQAFLGIDMKCARCHDAPYDPFLQSDLFSIAAMLGEQTVAVPKGSVVVVPPGGRQPHITSTLKLGDKIAPVWPLEDMIPPEAADEGVSLAQLSDRPRARLAAIVTSPEKTRFSDVLVNRVWQRYMGIGLVEPVDHWLERDDASHPDLLAHLSREFVVNGYDLKKLVRSIVTSDAYQRQVGPTAPPDATQRTFAAQTRRRLSAEQVVDSLFAAVGKPMNAEELNFDPNGTQKFLTLPAPERSWQFASLSNERDRPALALPVNQMILDVLTTFGWRETRPDPWTRKDAEPNPLQPLMLANSNIVNQVVRLTEDNRVTEWCLEDLSVEQLAERLFLAFTSRKPSPAERELLVVALSDGYADRKTGKPKPPPVERIRAHVDWDKHLKGEASVELLAAEKQARAGDPPTVRLKDDFRRRVEDVVWALINSPEFVFVP